MALEHRTRRRSLRRAVVVDCALRSDLWDDELCLEASNLSTAGMWVETPIALEPGSHVIVSFTPPGVQRGKRVWAAAEVVRVDAAAAEPDGLQAGGMALAFTYCSEGDRRLLARALVGCPPRLPARCGPPPLPRSPARACDE
jgi:hypothetical protein